MPVQQVAYKDQQRHDSYLPQPREDYFQRHRYTRATKVNDTQISLADFSPGL